MMIFILKELHSLYEMADIHQLKMSLRIGQWI